MNHLKTIGLIAVGILIGYFVAQVLPGQLNHPVAAEQPVQPPPQCVQAEKPPPCPCLFSDEILDPPKFASENGIVTNADGEARISWIERAGAKKYKIFIEDQAGKLIKLYTTPKSVIFIRDIPLPENVFEAHYIVRLASVNGKDETGPKGDSRPLHVKPQASVVAPQIQEIRVED